MTFILREILDAAERDGMTLEDALNTHGGVCDVVKLAAKLRAAFDPVIEAARDAAEGNVPEAVIRDVPEVREAFEQIENVRDRLKSITEQRTFPEIADAVKRATHDLDVTLSRFSAAVAREN